jgi:hypothetical protein
MMRFKTVALSPTLAQRLRRDMQDEHGLPVEVRRDEGRHQCRVCLKLTDPNEPYLLFSYSPFERETPYSERGPIFIHQRECSPYDPDGGYPDEFPRHEVVLRGYNVAGEIEDAEYVGEREVEEVAAALIPNNDVATVHVRNGSWGCFMFRIERTS